MTIEEVLREMREMREINSNFRVTAEWASAIEAAMREQSAEIELLNKLLTECVQYVPLQVMSCEGHKCDEPWCTSCNTEDDAREAVDEANAVLQRVRSRPRR